MGMVSAISFVDVGSEVRDVLFEAVVAQDSLAVGLVACSEKLKRCDMLELGLGSAERRGKGEQRGHVGKRRVKYNGAGNNTDRPYLSTTWRQCRSLAPSLPRHGPRRIPRGGKSASRAKVPKRFLALPLEMSPPAILVRANNGDESATSTRRVSAANRNKSHGFARMGCNNRRHATDSPARLPRPVCRNAAAYPAREAWLPGTTGRLAEYFRLRSDGQTTQQQTGRAPLMMDVDNAGTCCVHAGSLPCARHSQTASAASLPVV